MFLFLTVIQALVAAALVGVILMQRSEGGGLGIGGGSPTGMLSARGAADFMTRATKWLAMVFVVLSIVLAAMAVEGAGTGAIESTLERTTAPAAPADPLGAPAPSPTTGPATADPLGTPAN